MAEKRIEVRTIMVRLMCDKCGEGEMKPTGVALMSHPPQYPHKCDKCGAETTIRGGKTYPRMEYEEVTPNSSAQPAPSIAEQDKINAEAAIRSIYDARLSDEALWQTIANGMITPAHIAQPAPSDEYVGWYCAHCERGVDASEVTYHEQHQVCGRVITEDKPPKPAPSIPEGWLRAIDEALVVTHLGVANASDTYEQAREKLTNLIGWHVDVATDPAVNGGWKLVPLEPTSEMLCVGEDALVPTYADTPVSVPFDVYRAMLAAAPKPEGE